MTLDYEVSGEVNISQKGFVDKFLTQCDDVLGESNAPHDVNLFKVDNDLPMLDENKQDLFHSRTQSLLYLVKRTRADMQTVVGFLGRRVKKATIEDWTKLRKTKNQKLRLRCGSGDIITTSFVDVAYGCHADGKSHTGCCIYIGDYGAVYCKSSRQTIVTKSSSEAE